MILLLLSWMNSCFRFRWSQSPRSGIPGARFVPAHAGLLRVRHDHRRPHFTRLRQRHRATNGSALQRWLDAKTARQGTDWERRTLVGFGLLGTGVVTIVLGPIVTPWLAQGRGLNRRYGTAAVGSVFWSVSLVATYSGLMALIL